VKEGESCGSVSDENSIEKDELYDPLNCNLNTTSPGAVLTYSFRRDWNPNIGSTSDETTICEVGVLGPLRQGKCRIPCGDLWPGYYLCVKA